MYGSRDIPSIQRYLLSPLQLFLLRSLCIAYVYRLLILPDQRYLCLDHLRRYLKKVVEAFTLRLALFPCVSFDNTSATSIRKSERLTPDVDTMASNQYSRCIRILLHRLCSNSISPRRVKFKAKYVRHPIRQILLIRGILDDRYLERIVEP